MIYFVKSRATGHIKIGFTKDFERRFSSIDSFMPGGVEFLGYLPGGRDLEKYLHNRFAETRDTGEWFRPSPDLDDFLRLAVTKERPTETESLNPFERLRLQEERYVGEAAVCLRAALVEMGFERIPYEEREHHERLYAAALGLSYFHMKGILSGDIESITAGVYMVCRLAEENAGRTRSESGSGMVDGSRDGGGE